MKLGRILCTRPIDQNDQWAQKAQKLGRTVVKAPLLALSPLSQPEHIQAIKQCIMNLDRYQHVIFVSQNAVDFSFQWIEKYWPQLPSGINWLPIGKKTAFRLQSQPSLTSAIPSNQQRMTSEELLQLPSLQNIEQSRVLICRGLGGRPLMADELTSRGARVDLCELYQRDIPKEAAKLYTQLHLQPNDIVPVFSGETLTNLHTTIHDNLNHWQDIAVIVPSRRVADQAISYGFNHVICADNASEDCMYESLERLVCDAKKTCN